MLDTDYNGPVFMARQVFFPKTEAWNNLDQPYPSALLLGHPGGQPVHVVVARNPVDGACTVITAYRPHPTLWADDFRTRRR
ncbi:DUF4258 domain-containing protein [uncultured Thiohalocapsa sp.]|uniref:DUF4258 domain-containing protein n=1 Tax=uncultured Thiohalocapsa sp. TaxID=768990 RepID=UPI0025CE6BCA|nr:DUF4258 domain-containing protein [uncultured Thiohalocapsa sp.]